MTPLHLMMRNFRLFAGKHEFDFCLGYDKPRPGLYLVTGHNNFARRLGANGVGKSTLFDAIVWCLYGKTLRKLKAQDVRTSWLDKQCRVKLRLIGAAGLMVVRRSWNPNALEVSYDNETTWKTIQQEKLDKKIGLTYSDMLFAQIFGQFNLKFFDLQPSQKLELFTEALDLDLWSVFSARASGRAQAKFIELSDLSVRASELGGSLISLRTTRDSLKRRVEEVDVNRDKDLKKCLDEQVVAAARLKKAQESLELLNVQLEDAQNSVKKYRRRCHLLDLRCVESNSMLTAAEVTIKEATRRRDEAQASLDALDRTGTSCPVCGQALSVQHLRGERMRLRERLDAARAELRTATKLKPEAQAAREEDNAKFQTVNRKKMAAESELSSVNIKIARADAELSSAKSDLRAILNDIKDLRENVNPFLDELMLVRKTITKNKQELVTIQSTKEESEKQHRALQFWASGFRDLRLSIIEEHLAALEVAVNASAESLGLMGWHIKFDVEKENRSGGLSRGFHVLLNAPGSSNDLPWESWGGGETQRLKVAGAVGMSDLILSQRGIASQFEVWDEPTSHMSPEGVESLLDTLAERARSSAKQIWVVEHTAVPMGNFTGVIRVTRDVEGSYIEEVG